VTLVANSIFLPPMELCKNQGQTGMALGFCKSIL
jgi:hypothetical protein